MNVPKPSSRELELAHRIFLEREPRELARELDGVLVVASAEFLAVRTTA